MDELTYPGVWWLPENPDAVVAGTLTYRTAEDPILELIGSLRLDPVSNQTFQPEFVLGVASSGKRITLYRCLETKRTINIGGSGLIVSYVAADFLFVGAHLSTLEDLYFLRFAVCYDLLGEWARQSGFSFTISNDQETKEFLRYELAYEFPGSNEVSVEDFRVRFSQTFNQKGGLLEDYHLEQTTFLEVRPPDPKPFDWYLQVIYHLRNFVALGVSHPIYPTQMRATLEVEVIAGSTIEHTRDVEVFARVDRGESFDTTSVRVKMLFNFPQIRSEYEKALNCWFERAPTLQPVYDLYFSTLYNPAAYGEGRFLSLAQALETYHRRVMGGTYLTEDEYGVLKQILIESMSSCSLDTDTRSVFKGKIQYLNEFSLRRRVRDLVAFFEPIAGKYIPQASRFAASVVDTRNYLTHYNPSLQASAATGKRLYVLTEQLRFLLELCFLHELGLPPELRESIVAGHQRYLRLSILLKSSESDQAPSE